MTTFTETVDHTEDSVAHYTGPKLSSDSEVVELPLLLPRWQVDALEEAANQQGMTTGQMIRRVISNIFRPQR